MRQIIIGAVLGFGAFYLYTRQLDRALSGTGNGSNPPRNEATGPRLPGMPDHTIWPGTYPPVSGAVPNMPAMPSMPAMPTLPGNRTENGPTAGTGWVSDWRQMQ